MLIFFKPHISYLQTHATDPDKRRYAVKEDGKTFVKGVLTKIYYGTEDSKPCTGVVLDNGNGYLLDKSRKITKIRNQ